MIHRFLPLLLLLCALPLFGQTVDPPDPLGNVTFFEPVLFAKEDPLKGLPYVMRRTRRNPQTRQYEQHYALFDDYLRPVTDFIFDAKINSRFQASSKSITQLLNLEPPAGYGLWVGYMRKDKAVILIDAAGKRYEVEPD